MHCKTIKFQEVINITKISKHIYIIVKLQKKSLANLLLDYFNTENIKYKLFILALTQIYILF